MDNWKAIQDLIIEYYGDGSWYFVLYIISLLYLLIWNKEERKRLVIPSLVITIFVLNPITYKLMESMYWYWRMLWMFPMIPIIGIAVIHLLKKCRFIIIKVVICLLFITLIVKGGDPVYDSDIDEWQISTNPYKIPQSSINVADTLLELSDEPRAIVPDTMFCYIRQYSTDIHLMYGRDILNYIATDYVNEDAWMVHWQLDLEDPDLNIVFDLARRNGYEFIVSRIEREIDIETAEMNGFQKICTVGRYEIYKDVMS